MKSLFCLLFSFAFIISCNGQLKLIKTQGSDQYQNAHCGLQDKAGNMWFGTTGEGVYRYDGKSFTNFTTKDGLSSNTVCSILEDKTGTIWLGTIAGICRYDPKGAVGKSFIVIPIAVANGRFFNPITPVNTNSYAKNAVWSMFQDKSGTIWFGTSDGVYRYNGKSFTRFLENDGVINKTGLHLKMIQCILEDKNGNMWFASWNREGVCRFNGKAITAFKPNDDDMIYSILEDRTGNLWFGTRDHGACRYDPKRADGKAFTDFSDIKVFSSSCIYSMAEDKSGTIWFGTEHGSGDKADTLGGVWRYDGQSFKNFTTKDGLSHNSVFSVTPDKSGRFWFGTRGTGLSRYDGKAFTNFSEKVDKQ